MDGGREGACMESVCETLQSSVSAVAYDWWKIPQRLFHSTTGDEIEDEMRISPASQISD